MKVPMGGRFSALLAGLLRATGVGVAVTPAAAARGTGPPALTAKTPMIFRDAKAGLVEPLAALRVYVH